MQKNSGAEWQIEREYSDELDQETGQTFLEHGFRGIDLSLTKEETELIFHLLEKEQALQAIKNVFY
ncbi:hypothetical protein [Laceyella tengchongensis]|jgi:hypothetical protein|uniref:hypothetical protein n=1 Tax=Laceyella tengchongensis TaxID=574699 RepID=UPI0012B8C0FA|nr:hypothetical protein [Laceyella tengchongensis]